MVKKFHKYRQFTPTLTHPLMQKFTTLQNEIRSKTKSYEQLKPSKISAHTKNNNIIRIIKSVYTRISHKITIK